MNFFPEIGVLVPVYNEDTRKQEKDRKPAFA
jgi:hypothetical protein